MRNPVLDKADVMVRRTLGDDVIYGPEKRPHILIGGTVQPVAVGEAPSTWGSGKSSFPADAYVWSNNGARYAWQAFVVYDYDKNGRYQGTIHSEVTPQLSPFRLSTMAQQFALDSLYSNDGMAVGLTYYWTKAGSWKLYHRLTPKLQFLSWASNL